MLVLGVVAVFRLRNSYALACRAAKPFPSFLFQVFNRFSISLKQLALWRKCMRSLLRRRGFARLRL
ncbi:Unannotated [Lentimonas sp. CC11]|nr:Unannotated [Lentimonas sp. CC11]